ncbi:MAG: hypothetical protein COA43_06595 [Robiginitomaculum sp.]|nr:MAG: hypothetical protein COA43_06595 [Robiginitomaculum sp.]
MTKAVFLINPLSHTVLKKGSVLEAAAKTSNTPVFNLDPFDNLDTIVSQAFDNKTELVFIEGGDGTVQGILSAFLAHKTKAPLPKFVLLPGGMTNLVAKHVGVKKPNVSKVLSLLNADSNKTTTLLPLLNIAYEKHMFSGFLFSTGALPIATKYCHEKIFSLGINGVSAVRATLLRVLFGRGEAREIILSPTPMILEIDGIKVEDGHILTLSTTLSSLMIGLNPFWGTGDGAVKISHLRGGGKRFIRNVFRFLKSKQSETSKNKLARDGFRSWSVDTATMHYSGPLVLDGEFLPQTKKPIRLSASVPLSFIK